MQVASANACAALRNLICAKSHLAYEAKKCGAVVALCKTAMLHFRSAPVCAAVAGFFYNFAFYSELGVDIAPYVVVPLVAMGQLHPSAKGLADGALGRLNRTTQGVAQPSVVLKSLVGVAIAATQVAVRAAAAPSHKETMQQWVENAKGERAIVFDMTRYG